MTPRTSPAAAGTVWRLAISGGGVPKLAIPEARVTTLGLVGDVQHHRKFHGGPERALCLYSLEVIDRLRTEGHPIEPGSTGENVTLQGIDWAALHPGSRLELGGDVAIEITSLAVPCKQIAGSFANGRFVRIAALGDARLYARVLREGALRTGDRVIVRST